MSEHLQRNKEETLLGNASERLATRARAGSNAEHRMIGSGDRKLASSLSSVDRQRLTSQLVGIHRNWACWTAQVLTVVLCGRLQKWLEVQLLREHKVSWTTFATKLIWWINLCLLDLQHQAQWSGFDVNMNNHTSVVWYWFVYSIDLGISNRSVHKLYT